MSGKKRSRPNAGPQTPPIDYYDLKTKAIDDLVSANEENSPPVSAAEMKQYRSGPKLRMADWVKVLLLKLWTGGMICYFFIWGLSTFTMNQWDHLAVLGIALGLVTNLITNNILRFIASRRGIYDRWMMFPGKQLYWLPMDILYATLLVVCVVMTYNGLNLLLTVPDSAAVAIGVEPIGFGVIVTAWDLVFLGVKRLFLGMVADARRKVDTGHR